jgi:hypothetical protein
MLQVDNLDARRPTGHTPAEGVHVALRAAAAHGSQAQALEVLMRGSRSFRPDPGLDERALSAIASPYRLILPLVPVDPVLVGDIEAAGVARPTGSDHDRSDRTYPSGDNSRRSLGEAIVVVRLAQTQRNGVDVVVELLTGNQNGRLDGPLKPDARHTSDRDPDDELAPHPEHHELADHTAPTPDNDTRTTLRQPHNERSHTHPPRTGPPRAWSMLSGDGVKTVVSRRKPDRARTAPVPVRIDVVGDQLVISPGCDPHQRFRPTEGDHLSSTSPQGTAPSEADVVVVIAVAGSSVGPQMRATDASAPTDQAPHCPLAVYGDPVLAGGTELALGRSGRHRRLLVGLGLAGLLVTASLALAHRHPSDRPPSTPVAAPPATTTNPATNEPRVSPADPLQRALAEGHTSTTT